MNVELATRRSEAVLVSSRRRGAAGWRGEVLPYFRDGVEGVKVVCGACMSSAPAVHI